MRPGSVSSIASGIGILSVNVFHVAVVLLSLVTGSPMAADEIEQWEARPYQVLIWYRLPHVADLEGWQATLPVALAQGLHARFGSTWECHVESAPESPIDAWCGPSAPVDPGELLQKFPQLAKFDKLMVLTVQPELSGLRLAVRELDVAAWQWGPIHRGLVRQNEILARRAVVAVQRAFLRLGRIGRVRGQQAEVRLRAGLLAREAGSDQFPAAGTLFHVRIRLNDRLGRALPQGVSDVPWMVLRATAAGPSQEIAASQGRVLCDVVSGLRNPLRLRSTQQVARLALEVRPTHRTTRLQLLAATEGNRPLEGYGVFVRPDAGDALVPLGTTNWQGTIRLTRGDEHPLEVIYVKNGSRLLARLPIVVGAESQLRALLGDDDPRLEAEGFLRGVQEHIIDTLARRKVLTARIRLRLDEGRVPEAQALFDELQDLPTHDDFLRIMQDRQREYLRADRAAQARIEQLFDDTRQVLSQHPDGGEVEEARRLLKGAHP